MHKALLLAACLIGGAATQLHAAGKEREAVAKNDKLQWITSDDYPALALRFDLQGAVAVDMTVGNDGIVKNCAVTESSRHDVLDRATCELLSSRAVFEPALDRRGRPIQSTVRQRFRWTLPDDGSDAPFSARQMQLDMVIGADRKIESCTMTAEISAVDSRTADCLESGPQGNFPAEFLEAMPQGRLALRYSIEMTADHDRIVKHMISNEPGWQRLSLVLASSTLGLDGGKPGECALQESRGPDELVVPLCDMLAEERYTPFTDEDGKPVVGRIEGLAVAFYKPLGN